ncbi:hypothetical protein ACFYOK_10900 [Microbispora bryophytorum]
MTAPAETPTAPVKPAVSWRGGPDIGAYAEAEYAREQADFD